MSNDNTAKPTPGPWIVFTPDDREDCQTLGVESFDGKAVVWYGEFFDDGIPNDADAYLIAEAGTVYHETGLTPRQLQLERINLIVALHNIADIEDELDGSDWSEISHARDIARAAIAKCEAKP